MCDLELENHLGRRAVLIEFKIGKFGGSSPRRLNERIPRYGVMSKIAMGEKADRSDEPRSSGRLPMRNTRSG